MSRSFLPIPHPLLLAYLVLIALARPTAAVSAGNSPGVRAGNLLHRRVGFLRRPHPDQRTAYLCRATAISATTPSWRRVAPPAAGRPPARLSFSGRWSDADPHVSPDGRKLFFISNAPHHRGHGTGELRHLGGRALRRWGLGHAASARRPGESRRCDEWSPSVAGNGNLYFGTVRDGGKGGTTSMCPAGPAALCRAGEPGRLGEHQGG